jgi:ribosomal protein S17E
VGGEIVEQLDHQVELSEPLDKVLFIRLVLFKVVIQSLEDCYYPVRSSKWEENWRYLKQGQERSTKLVKNMVNLRIKRIGLEQRSPSLENGVRDLEHTNVDSRVGRRQLGNEILNRPKGQHCITTLGWETYIHESLPPLPEITVGDHTDGLTQLALDARRD